MRNDLTSPFLVKMASDKRSPIQCAVFHFENGDIFLSDRDIVVDGQLYDGVIEDWGELGTVGGEKGISGTMENTLTLWNGGDSPFSDLFLNEDPVDVFVDIYQIFEGLSPIDKAHVGEFVIQDPVEFSEASSLLKIEIVTSNMRYFGQVGQLLTKENFPYALEADLNKSINLIVGDAGRVRCLCSDKPPVTSLDRSIVWKTINIEVSDDLDKKGFATSGRIQINGELINYSSRGQFYFVASQRGYESLKTDHSAGSEVIQANKTVDYIIGQLPIQTPIDNIFKVWVKGKTTDLSYQFIRDTEKNVGLLRFAKQPIYSDLSPALGAKVYFDTTDAGNTALYPYFAYAENYKADGAILDKSHTALKISNQQDEIASRAEGEIVNVYLNITAWATLAYTAERVDVWVDGLGTIGRLTRPNEAAAMNIVAETDIDHPHNHTEDGSTHNHNSADAVRSNLAYLHPHATEATRGGLKDGSPASYEMFKSSNGSVGDTSEILFAFSVPGKFASSQVDLPMTVEIVDGGNLNFIEFISNWGSSFNIQNPGYQYTGVISVNTGNRYTSYTSLVITVKVRIGWFISGGGSVRVTFKRPNCKYDEIIDNTANTKSDVDAIKNANGYVVQQSVGDGNVKIKAQDDVDDLATGNRDLIIDEDETTSYTQRFTDNFDLLDFKDDIDWNWLHQKKVALTFVGSGKVEVYVTWIDFLVEYRKPVLKTTDEISCIPSGLENNRPDAVIQYLLTEKAGVPLEKLSSVYRDIPKWDDLDIWDDNEIWQDEGQVSGVPTGAAFEEAGAWFDFHNYMIDGIIPGDFTIKDAIQDLTWQTRSKLLWQNGKAQLTIQRKSNAWNIAKDVSIDDIQLRSFEAFKSNADDVVNKIDLFHTIDRLSNAEGSGMYDASASVHDSPSILKHGEKVKDNMWLFYLLRNNTMAESVADYYLWLLGETSTYYKFATYLNNFDLEKEDYITVNSYRFAHLMKLPVVIRELVREFGSGKINKINLLRIIAQSIRHYFFVTNIESNVVCSDSLNIDFGSELDFDDCACLEDLLEFLWTKNFEEELTVSDIFEIVANYNSEFPETIQINSELSCDIQVALEDSIAVDDLLDIAGELCFGACGFGSPNCEIPFGSRTVHRDTPFEQLQCIDILSSAMGIGLSEDINISDNLLFSDGFGCPAGLGEGMGSSPFGDLI